MHPVPAVVLSSVLPLSRADSLIPFPCPFCGSFSCTLSTCCARQTTFSWAGLVSPSTATGLGPMPLARSRDDLRPPRALGPPRSLFPPPYLPRTRAEFGPLSSGRRRRHTHRPRRLPQGVVMDILPRAHEHLPCCASNTNFVEVERIKVTAAHPPERLRPGGVLYSTNQTWYFCVLVLPAERFFITSVSHHQQCRGAPKRSPAELRGGGNPCWSNPRQTRSPAARLPRKSERRPAWTAVTRGRRSRAMGKDGNAAPRLSRAGKPKGKPLLWLVLEKGRWRAQNCPCQSMLRVGSVVGRANQSARFGRVASVVWRVFGELAFGAGNVENQGTIARRWTVVGLTPKLQVAGKLSAKLRHAPKERRAAQTIST